MKKNYYKLNPHPDFTKEQTRNCEIINAVSKNETDKLRELLKEIPHFDVTVPLPGEKIPVLHYAARLGNMEALLVMLEENGCAHVTCKYNWNILHYGAVMNNDDLISIGAQYGVNPRYADVYGYSPLMLAAYSGNVNPLISLLTKFPTSDNLINQQNYDGDTSLMLAIFHKEKTTSKELIKRKANIYLENDKDLSPAMIGIDNGIDVQKIQDDFIIKELHDKLEKDNGRSAAQTNIEIEFYNKAIDFVTNTNKEIDNRLLSHNFNIFLKNYVDRKLSGADTVKKFEKIKIHKNKKER